MITVYKRGPDGKPVRDKSWASWTDMALDGGYSFIVKRSAPGFIEAEIYTGELGFPRPTIQAASMAELIDALDLFFEVKFNQHDDRYSAD